MITANTAVTVLPAEQAVFDKLAPITQDLLAVHAKESSVRQGCFQVGR